jgi:hypothetical protein
MEAPILVAISTTTVLTVLVRTPRQRGLCLHCRGPSTPRFRSLRERNRCAQDDNFYKFDSDGILFCRSVACS